MDLEQRQDEIRLTPDLYFNPRCVSHYYNTIISYHILSAFYALAKHYST